MFAELYHAHHSLHNEDLAFWKTLASSTPGELLELGCGTGRVLRPLAEFKPRIFGLEKDAAMLHYLRQNLPKDLAEKARILQADFTRFRLALQFGLILLPCNTYSTLNSTERKGLLECISIHLTPGGRFVLSLPNPELLVSLPARSAPEIEEIFPHPRDGEPVQVSSGWRRARQAFILEWRYDHLLPDGTVDSLRVQATHFITPLETYLSELRTAGFSVLELWGDFDRSAYTSESPDLIIEVTK